jgi:hypothetical protein
VTCKCGARSFEGHLKKAEEGYPGHVYKGHYWAPKDDNQGVARRG